MSKPIPPLDLSWFLTESTSSPKHVGAVMVYEVPADRAGTAAEIVASYRKQAPTPPFNYVPKLVGAGGPVFVEAAEFDPAYHVQHLVLPAGATYESFLALVTDLHEPVLDRDRPLFRMWVIEGLPGNRFAVYFKVHHAVIDGASGAQRLFGSLRPTADRKINPPPFALEVAPRKPRLSKGLVEKLEALGTTTARQTLALKDVYLGAIRQGLGALLGAGKGGSVPFEAQRTPMNEQLGMARTFATMSLPLSEMKEVGRAFGATLNDVAATIVDEGVHRYLREAGQPFDDRLVGMCPISLRDEGDTDASTKASAMFVRLGRPDIPVAERIGEIVEAIARGKSELKGMSRDAAMLYAIAALGLAELFYATRLKHVTRPLANLVLSNVPGAPETMYLDGAKLTGSFPISALGMGVGLNVTLSSYADTMDFGFVGNRRALKDMSALARHTHDAYEELKVASVASKGKRRAPKAAQATAPAPAAGTGRKVRGAASAVAAGAARKRTRGATPAPAARGKAVGAKTGRVRKA
jgi:diacylglycerol O-acyltransferase / wax synthase